MRTEVKVEVAAFSGRNIAHVRINPVLNAARLVAACDESHLAGAF